MTDANTNRVAPPGENAAVCPAAADGVCTRYMDGANHCDEGDCFDMPEREYASGGLAPQKQYIEDGPRPFVIPEKRTVGLCLLERTTVHPNLCGVGSRCGVLGHASIYVCELALNHEGPHQATPPPFTWKCSSRCPNYRLTKENDMDDESENLCAFCEADIDGPPTEEALACDACHDAGA